MSAWWAQAEGWSWFLVLVAAVGTCVIVWFVGVGLLCAGIWVVGKLHAS
jgi:hypothetical protein